MDRSKDAINGTVRETRRLYAVNSSGARIRAKSADPLSGLWEWREIYLPSQGKRVLVSEKLHALVTYYLPDVPARVNSSTPSPNCAPKSPVPHNFHGADSVLGYQVFKYSRTERMQSAELVSFEYWYAPALDCEIIRAVAEFRGADGTLAGSSEKVAVAINRGEPDATLFEIPAGYTEMKPSELQKLSLEVEGRPGPWPDSLERTWELHDEKYKKAQKPKR